MVQKGSGEGSKYVADMVDNGGIPPGMVYMPMGPHGMAGAHAQQQWPMMPSWMGMTSYYHLPPGQSGMQV